MNSFSLIGIALLFFPFSTWAGHEEEDSHETRGGSTPHLQNQGRKRKQPEEKRYTPIRPRPEPVLLPARILNQEIPGIEVPASAPHVVHQEQLSEIKRSLDSLLHQISYLTYLDPFFTPDDAYQFKLEAQSWFGRLAHDQNLTQIQNRLNEISQLNTTPDKKQELDQLIHATPLELSENQKVLLDHIQTLLRLILSQLKERTRNDTRIPQYSLDHLIVLTQVWFGKLGCHSPLSADFKLLAHASTLLNPIDQFLFLESLLPPHESLLPKSAKIESRKNQLISQSHLENSRDSAETEAQEKGELSLEDRNLISKICLELLEKYLNPRINRYLKITEAQSTSFMDKIQGAFLKLNQFDATEFSMIRDSLLALSEFETPQLIPFFEEFNYHFKARSVFFGKKPRISHSTLIHRFNNAVRSSIDNPASF